MRPEATDTGDGAIDAASRRRRPRRLSDMFAKLAHEADGSVSIGNIRDAMGARSFAPMLVMFAALNLLPLPPGTSAILGLPLILISAQMVYGSKRVWLPSYLSNRSLSAGTFRSMMDWIIPRLVRIERVIRPRYWPFWRKQGDRIVGFIALILAIVVTLPIPLGNWLPAFATALLGLALSERDGILLAVGGAVCVVSMIVIAGVVGVAGMATNAALSWLF